MSAGTTDTPKIGAPKGNWNSLRNGTRIMRLPIGVLPKELKRQETNARMYRRELEAAVIQSTGEVGLAAAHYIDEAVGAEIHMSICRWLLRTRMEKMSVADITRCSEQILKSKTIRNRAFERLRLNVNERDALLALYCDTTAQDEPDEPPATETSSAGIDTPDANPTGETKCL